MRTNNRPNYNMTVNQPSNNLIDWDNDVPHRRPPSNLFQARVKQQRKIASIQVTTCKTITNSRTLAIDAPAHDSNNVATSTTDFVTRQDMNKDDRACKQTETNNKKKEAPTKNKKDNENLENSHSIQ